MVPSPSPTTPNRRRRIAFLHRGNLTTFMERDLDMLARHHDVTPFQYDSYRDAPALARALHGVDLAFCWFPDAHAAFAALFTRFTRTPLVVVEGGYGVARVPEIGYGAFAQGPINHAYVRYALKGADRVLAVDPSLIDDAAANARIDVSHFEYLPTGYDADHWSPSPDVAREDVVLTVGGVGHDVVKRKGFETFVRTAALVPEARFVLVGKRLDDSMEHLRSLAPDNVTFTGFVTEDELLQWYRRAKVYCQLSRYEGLPNALCEAMLCGCIPVGTDQSGIPRAMGDVGVTVPYGDVDATADAVRSALAAPEEDRRLGRDHIARTFPESRREEGLLRVVDEVALRP